MPENRKRRRSADPFQLLLRRLTGIQTGIEQSLLKRQRTRRLRRLRRRRTMGTYPSTRQSFIAAFRSISWPRSRRRQPRTQQATETRAHLRTVLFAPAQTLTISQVVGHISRHAASALFIFAVLTTVFPALPLRLGSSNWYLSVLGALADNVPIFLLVALFSVLSLSLCGDSSDASSFRSSLIKRSRLAYIFALLLVPLQIGLTAWLFSQTLAEGRVQFNAILANSDALISGAQQSRTTPELIAYLRSRNVNADFQSISSTPLLQVKNDFIRGVRLQQQQQQQSLDASLKRALFRFGKDSAKLLATLVILAFFMRTYQSLIRFSISSASTPPTVPQPADLSDQPQPGDP